MNNFLKLNVVLAVLVFCLTACDSDTSTDPTGAATVQAFDTLVLEVLDLDADDDAVGINEREFTSLSDEDEDLFSALF